jgi:hypothetical protein
MPITINIAYSLRNPVDGFQFILPTDSHPYVSTNLADIIMQPYQRVMK